MGVWYCQYADTQLYSIAPPLARQEIQWLVCRRTLIFDLALARLSGYQLLDPKNRWSIFDYGRGGIPELNYAQFVGPPGLTTTA